MTSVCVCGVCVDSAHTFTTQTFLIWLSVSFLKGKPCFWLQTPTERALSCPRRRCAATHAAHLICGVFGTSVDVRRLCVWLVCLSFQVCVSVCVFALEVDEVQ